MGNDTLLAASGLAGAKPRKAPAKHQKWAKPAAFLTAFTLMVGGLFLGNTLLAPEASAASSHKTGVFPVQAANPGSSWWASSNQITQPLAISDQSLYIGGLNFGWGTLATGGQLPTNGTVERFGSQQQTGGGGPNPGSDVEWNDTLAVDADVDGVRGAKYGYSWDFNAVPSTVAAAYRTSTGNTIPSGVTDVNSMPLFRIKDGETKAQYTVMPTPAWFGATDGAYLYWSGGEVLQGSGKIMLSAAECTSLNQSFTMMVFDPATGEYNFSGTIQPATTGDNIFSDGAMNPCPGPGYVASDMALDSVGNAYIVVTSDQAAPTFGLNAATRMWLVRVVPSETSNWTYELVAPLTAGAGQGAVAIGTNAQLIYGLAFYQGNLYALYGGATNLVRINPTSGQVFNIPNGTSAATVYPLSYDLASGQTATVVQGTVYNDTAGDGSVAGDPALAS
ncbi:MAG: hypothetical protein LBI33_01465, partial [Propionibacteriaceae bacterium]|nr:hypothetical protein [Propionibacteriaceae bacterium]